MSREFTLLFYLAAKIVTKNLKIKFQKFRNNYLRTVINAGFCYHLPVLEKNKYAFKHQ